MINCNIAFPIFALIMFKWNSVFYLLSAFVLLFSSCKNDFDVIDDYKETTIVYSLLNFKDTSQYIRIQKAFLGEGNAYLMAQQSDSIYPDTSDFIVTLQKINNGTAIDSFIRFSPVTGIQKEEGLFTNFPHVVYKSIDNPLTSLKEDYTDKTTAFSDIS